ncbi:MAG TPA: DUF1345 domain-containing protein [Rhizomicrobium sp.]|jgi:uncharacterized membrane protein|nr:DUF1345 domain-containing protein [Rhizomicrobium sp.]
MSSRMMTAFRRHVRFCIALICGIAALLTGQAAGFSSPFLLGGDVFYLVFLMLITVMTANMSAREFRKRAKSEDEGIAVVILVILATLLFFFTAVFEALNRRHGIQWVPLVLAGIGAPLGWLVLHTAMAFHYGDIHYFDDPLTAADDHGDLDFPGRGEPCPWDFLYFSFVIGMTCQVSDVQVKTTVMRRTVLWHGLVSFFFNTVFIAMAVNAAVAMAS